jgi:hypothetical protein
VLIDTYASKETPVSRPKPDRERIDHMSDENSIVTVHKKIADGVARAKEILGATHPEELTVHLEEKRATSVA